MGLSRSSTSADRAPPLLLDGDGGGEENGECRPHEFRSVKDVAVARALEMGAELQLRKGELLGRLVAHMEG
jgi:hypothetical protein